MSDAMRRRGRIADEDDVISTPEGDNEYPPNVPVGPVEGLEVPPGSAPSPYESDKPGHSPNAHGHEGPVADVEETVDKLSVGQILT